MEADRSLRRGSLPRYEQPDVTDDVQIPVGEDGLEPRARARHRVRCGRRQSIAHRHVGARRRVDGPSTTRLRDRQRAVLGVRRAHVGQLALAVLDAAPVVTGELEPPIVRDDVERHLERRPGTGAEREDVARVLAVRGRDRGGRTRGRARQRQGQSCEHDEPHHACVRLPPG